MKVIIGLLFFLLVAIVGVGVYAFDLLNNQIGTLNDELTAFRGETASQIETVSDELTAFRGETASQIETVRDELTAFRGETASQMTVRDELTAFRGETASQIETVSDELTVFRGETAGQIETVRDEQTGAYVSKIYEQVKWGVVEVVVKKEDEESIGSGFVFDAKGHIVTNYHVVREATEIDVVLFERCGLLGRAAIRSPDDRRVRRNRLRRRRRFGLDRRLRTAGRDHHAWHRSNRWSHPRDG